MRCAAPRPLARSTTGGEPHELLRLVRVTARYWAGANASDLAALSPCPTGREVCRGRSRPGCHPQRMQGHHPGP